MQAQFDVHRVPKDEDSTVVLPEVPDAIEPDHSMSGADVLLVQITTSQSVTHVPQPARLHWSDDG